MNVFHLGFGNYPNAKSSCQIHILLVYLIYFLYIAMAQQNTFSDEDPWDVSETSELASRSELEREWSSRKAHFHTVSILVFMHDDDDDNDDEVEVFSSVTFEISCTRPLTMGN